MTQEIFFRKFIAVGQKNSASVSSYGEGFNYWLEIGLRLTPDLISIEVQNKISEVVAQMDHRALGLDVKLGFEPTTAQLCAHVARKLRAVCGESGVKVRLIRGDELVAEVAEP